MSYEIILVAHYYYGGMMYYKVIKNNKVIDVLDKLIFLKYQSKHDIMIVCESNEAQAILSSDSITIWHEETLNEIPVDRYGTVKIEEIDEHEYRQFKALSLCSVQEILEDYTMQLIETGVL